MTLHRALLGALLLVCGCAGPGPSGFPAPRTGTFSADLSYDVDADGSADLILRRSGTTVHAVQFGEDAQRPHPGSPDVPHLLLIVDSIPHTLAHEAHQNGWFQLFGPPSQLISPFPVMTDVALADLYEMFPLPGVESQFLQNGKLNDATDAYLSETNMPWTARMDYRMEPLGHAFAYSDPYPWLGHELGRIERRGLAALQAGQSYAAYVVGTSALGSHAGRTGHAHALRQLEQLCLRVFFEMDGHVQITLMSDHGHDFEPGAWFSLARALREIGFKVGQRQGEAIEAIVPEWGLVSCAAVYTPVPEQISQAAVLLEGVEHCAMRIDDAVVVYGKEGQAQIRATGADLQYERITGDPLQLLDSSQNERTLPRTEWVAATRTSPWPASVTRLWDAFNGYFVTTPDVLVSLGPGHYVGSPDLRKRLAMKATHGSLRAEASMGFVMSTAGPLPETLAMDALPSALDQLGIGLPGQTPAEAATIQPSGALLAE